jgi:hypothetical protein
MNVEIGAEAAQFQELPLKCGVIAFLWISLNSLSFGPVEHISKIIHPAQ